MTAPIALFFGTRPQIIKASVLREALAAQAPVFAVDTGQHYDYALHQVHYDQLGIRPPDAFLDIGSGSHAAQTASILTACEALLQRRRVRAMVVIGDTNTTIACALAAAKLRVPVAHVEAGLRAGDPFMAEEINRRVVDAVARWLFTPSARVTAAMHREHPEATVVDVGDIAYDVLRRALPLVPPVESIPGYDSAWQGQYAFATLHRAELVDVPEKLRNVIDALNRSPLPVVLATHPRTAARLGEFGIRMGSTVHVSGPVGYLESVALTRCAAVVVTDSGGLQREAYWLGRPCVTVRAETEWTETIDCGANTLVSPERPEVLPERIAALAAPRGAAAWDRTAYGDGDAARRVANHLTEALF
jgi:UDP-N-acetylglucosamine 2-epimerase